MRGNYPEMVQKWRLRTVFPIFQPCVPHCPGFGPKARKPICTRSTQEFANEEGVGDRQGQNYTKSKPPQMCRLLDREGLGKREEKKV